MQMDGEHKEEFRRTVREFYGYHGRHELPWRTPEANGDFDPYKIMVSELMLQQTQVRRVTLKYREFLAAFPSVQAVAESQLGEVLRVWNGLGYNRRAQYLHQSARLIATEHGGVVPHSFQALLQLPGIGSNTAGAILAYAFNEPVVFVETNIRTVYIHHFFPGNAMISDADIRPIVEATLDRQHPREWYWALMDYGSYLKRTAGNATKRSSFYVHQSPFGGSRRQVRGKVIKSLLDGPLPLDELQASIRDNRLEEVLSKLTDEGIIRQANRKYRLC